MHVSFKLNADQCIMLVKRLAAETNTIVIATIHQPAWETFTLFDSVLLLANGRIMYSGPTETIDDYLTLLGHPTPPHANPADAAMQLVNSEFYIQRDGGVDARQHLDQLATRWQEYAKDGADAVSPAALDESRIDRLERKESAAQRLSEAVRKTLILSDRNVKNYSRNLLAYGIRCEYLIGRIRLDRLTCNLSQWACMSEWDCCWPSSGSISARAAPKSMIVSLFSESRSRPNNDALTLSLRSQLLLRRFPRLYVC